MVKHLHLIRTTRTIFFFFLCLYCPNWNKVNWLFKFLIAWCWWRRRRIKCSSKEDFLNFFDIVLLVLMVNDGETWLIAANKIHLVLVVWAISSSGCGTSVVFAQSWRHSRWLVNFKNVKRIVNGPEIVTQEIIQNNVNFD